MGEDRRPNVGGQDLPQDPQPNRHTSGEELRREARLLRDRDAADGHEPPAADAEDTERERR